MWISSKLIGQTWVYVGVFTVLNNCTHPPIVLKTPVLKKKEELHDSALLMYNETLDCTKVLSELSKVSITGVSNDH